jgi:membrane protein implicated in regulation of membrane protease activity
MFGFLKRSEAPDPFSTEDLVGQDAFVAVGITAGHWGSVYVKAEGQNHEYTATASEDIAAGTQVLVTGTAANGLVVALKPRPATEAGAPG